MNFTSGLRSKAIMEALACEEDGAGFCEEHPTSEWRDEGCSYSVELAEKLSPAFAALNHDLIGRLLCIVEACSWDRPYENRIEAIRGMCDLSQNGLTPVAESDAPQPDPADPLADAIAREAEAAFVTHYVVVAATVDQDGNSGTHMIPSPGLPLWMQHGLLAYEAAATVPQPFYERPDDDDGA